MNIETIFDGHGELSEDFITSNMMLPRTLRVENILRGNGDEAARDFVELAIRATKTFTPNNYIENMIKLLLRLAEKDGFYENLVRHIYKTDYERMLPETRLFLYSII